MNRVIRPRVGLFVAILGVTTALALTSAACSVGGSSDELSPSETALPDEARRDSPIPAEKQAQQEFEDQFIEEASKITPAPGFRDRPSGDWGAIGTPIEVRGTPLGAGELYNRPGGATIVYTI